MKQQNEIIGMDLGSDNSAGGIYDGKVIRLAQDSSGGNNIPSVLLKEPDGSWIGGNNAKALAEFYPERTIQNMKLLLGEENGFRNDPDTQEKIPLPKMVGLYINILMILFRDFFSAAIDKAVITVPALATRISKEKTVDAYKIGGIEVLKMMPEPEAALKAHFYGQKMVRAKNTIVFDVGGGTTDIARAVIDNEHCEVQKVYGDNSIGGLDLDRAMMELLAETALDKGVTLPLDDPEFRLSFKDKAEKAKILIGQNNRVVTHFKVDKKPLELAIQREEYKEAAKDVYSQMMQPLKDALAEADDVDGILLCGGPSRSQITKEIIKEIAGDIPLLKDENPQTLVVRGAALEAGSFAASKTSYFLPGFIKNSVSVTSEELGVECLDGQASGLVPVEERLRFEPLIPANSTLPAEGAKVFNLESELQTGVKIEVCTKTEAGYDKIGETHLDDIPPGPREERVKVIFNIDENGLLNIEGIDLLSNKKVQSSIEWKKGLTAQEVNEAKKDVARIIKGERS